MRRPVFALATLSLALIGCSTSAVRYQLSFDTADAAKQKELTEASKRVVERRLSRLSTEPVNIQIEAAGGATVFSLSLKDNKVQEELTSELLAPFSLSIMLLKSGSGGDLYVEEQGWFVQTGISEKDIIWTEAGQDADGKGTVTLEFTDAGRALLESVTREHVGETLGLFVRNRLMSKMSIDEEGLREKISIAGIPSPEIAGIFADDVNTGIHVKFSVQ